MVLFSIGSLEPGPLDLDLSLPVMSIGSYYLELPVSNGKVGKVIFCQVLEYDTAAVILSCTIALL